MSAVWELDLPKEQKLVLLAIADHANDDGFCWPSMSRIAWKCGYEQKRTVSDIIKKLLASEVLVIIERASGRTPTKYQVRPHLAARLPDFQPDRFRSDSGAENAPHDDEGNGNSLSDKGSPQQRDAIDARNAPQQPAAVDNRSVGVRSDALGVRSSARRGAVATAPESYNHQQNPDARARAGPGQNPARAATPQVPSAEFLLDNEALQLGISKRQRNESLIDYRGRIQAAHDRKLHAAAAEFAARKRERTEAEPAPEPKPPDEAAA